MKLLRAIFQNALILATLVTMVAGAILVTYADRQAADSRKAQGVALQADEGVPLNLIAATNARREAAQREADEGKPPGMAMKADEGVPHNLVVAAGGRWGERTPREVDEGLPPGMTA